MPFASPSSFIARLMHSSQPTHPQRATPSRPPRGSGQGRTPLKGREVAGGHWPRSRWGPYPIEVVTSGHPLIFCGGSCRPHPPLLKPPLCPCLSLQRVSLIARKGFVSPMGDTLCRHQPEQRGEIGRTLFVGSALLQGDTVDGAPTPSPVSPCSRPTHTPSHQTPTHPPTPAHPGGENRLGPYLSATALLGGKAHLSPKPPICGRSAGFFRLPLCPLPSLRLAPSGKGP